MHFYILAECSSELFGSPFLLVSICLYTLMYWQLLYETTGVVTSNQPNFEQMFFFVKGF